MTAWCSVVSPCLSMCPRDSLGSRYVLVSNSSLRAPFLRRERAKTRAPCWWEKKDSLRRRRSFSACWAESVATSRVCQPACLLAEGVAYIPAWKADQWRRCLRTSWLGFGVLCVLPTFSLAVGVLHVGRDCCGSTLIGVEVGVKIGCSSLWSERFLDIRWSGIPVGHDVTQEAGQTACV